MARSVGRPTPPTVRRSTVGGVGVVGGTFRDSRSNSKPREWRANVIPLNQRSS